MTPTPTSVKWQPIETAPKDGTVVLVWPPTWAEGVSCAKWEDEHYNTKPRPFWYRIDALSTADCRRKPPTHWAPLPAGPV
jgi:hypothetical protein